MKRRCPLETQLGPPVVEWLTGQGCEVYQEVEVFAGRADVVGTLGRLVDVVELKVGLTFELLEQAIRWRAWAHRVWVAVPPAKDHRRMARRVFADHGIGVLLVDTGVYGRAVQLVERPAFNRRAFAAKIRDRLRPEHKTFAPAGTARGGHWTEFKSTCALLRDFLATHPGATIGEVVKGIKHHYVSDAGARARLVELIQRGVVEGVRVEREGRTVRLFLGSRGDAGVSRG